MNIKFIAIPAIALAAGISLAACGSAKAPVAAPAVTHTVTAPTAAPKPTTPAPTTPAPTTAAPVAPAPAKTVYVAPARVAAPAPAAPAVQTNCGNDVYAGANAGCAFAQNVAAAYPGGMGGTAVVYSPVTGES